MYLLTNFRVGTIISCYVGVVIGSVISTFNTIQYFYEVNKAISTLIKTLILLINPFFLKALFLYPLNTSENLTIFWCFQGVEKWCIGNKWVNVQCVKQTVIQDFDQPIDSLIVTLIGRITAKKMSEYGFSMTCIFPYKDRIPFNSGLTTYMRRYWPD